MTPSDKARLLELAGKATQGERFVNTFGGPNRTEVFAGKVLICDTLSGTHDRFEGLSAEADAAFIAAAHPQAVIELLEENERLTPASGLMKETITLPYRRMRAQQLTAHVVNAISKHVERQRDDRDYDALREISHTLFHLFHASGGDIISDADRAVAGLLPRNGDGVTREELQIMEARRVHAMLNAGPFLSPQEPTP